jgi:hypothetical protein
MLLEVPHIVLLPGDPSAEDYDDRLPDFCNLLIFAMGAVTSGHDGVPGRGRHVPRDSV